MNADEIVKALRTYSPAYYNYKFDGATAQAIYDAADLIESLQAQLAAEKRRADAAVGDLRKHRKYKCDCCYYAGKQGKYIPCRDCQSPISTYGDGWQWRGQQAGKGDAPNE